MTGGYLARARHLVPRPIRRAASHVLSVQRAGQIESELARLAGSGRPIVVGPWLGEVGFELLYWVPFVRWFAARHGVASDRLVVVTRGGAAEWYRPFAARAIDALTLVAPSEFRARNRERTGELGEQKQVAVSAFDERLLRDVDGVARDAAVLHPSLMYRLFAPYWWGHEPMSWVLRYTTHCPFEHPAPPVGLPPRYTAVKFYFNDGFEDSPANRAFVERTVRRLAEAGPVVSLATRGDAVDEHAVCDAGHQAVRTIDSLVSPETNLAVQSAVIAGAERFVGTYGGFAYLAPSYRVPTLSYYADRDGFSARHLDLARAIFAPRDDEAFRVEQVTA